MFWWRCRANDCVCRLLYENLLGVLIVQLICLMPNRGYSGGAAAPQPVYDTVI